MEFPPIRYAVPGLIPEGCSILAGLPKLGKSWLVLDIALAVARGDYCLGDIRCEQGDVLYLALEDNQRRLKSRIEKVSAPKTSEPWPKSLRLATEWRRCEEGGLDDIRKWAMSASNPRLVIVDVLAQFRSGRAEGQNHYEYDYRAVKGLQELASEFGLTIIVVHHVRKGHGDVDPFERVSGTLGLTGAADTTVILDRGGSGCTLYARGRDVEEYEKAVVFNRETCRWTLQGDASEVRRTDERGAILAALEDAVESMTPKEIQIATGMARNNLDQLLFKMAKAGEVLRPNRGSYAHPSRSDLIAAAAAPSGKNGKKVRNPGIEEIGNG
jgi:RecA-family ATPase